MWRKLPVCDGEKGRGRVVVFKRSIRLDDYTNPKSANLIKANLIFFFNFFFHDLYLFLGKKVPQKLAEVRKAIKDLKADIMIVTALEDVACKQFN